MKKILLLILVAVLVFSTTSCGKYPLYDYDDEGNLHYDNHTYTDENCESEHVNGFFRMNRGHEEQIGRLRNFYGFPVLPLYRSQLDENTNFLYTGAADFLFYREGYTAPDIYTCGLENMEIGGLANENHENFYLLYRSIDSSLDGLSINDLVYTDETYSFDNPKKYYFTATVTGAPYLLADMHALLIDGKVYISLSNTHVYKPEEVSVYLVKEEYQEFFFFDTSEYQKGNKLRLPHAAARTP